MFARKLNALKYKGAEKLDLTNEGKILVFYVTKAGYLEMHLNLGNPSVKQNKSLCISN